MKRTLKRTLSVLLTALFLVGACAAGSGTLAADTGYQNGDVLEFGTYPQSRVTDADTLAALGSADKDWRSFGIFAARQDASSDPDYLMEQQDFMQYADVKLNGETYRAVRFSEYRPSFSTGYATVSTTVTNNYTYQNGYEINTEYWFKWEPLRWYVLDAATGLVFAESVLDVQAFNPFFYKNSDNKIWYRDKTCSAYAGEYAQSAVRSWLTDRTVENGFSSTAFSDWQWSKIGFTDLNNSIVQDADKPYAGDDTCDQVFCFSTYELYGEVQYTNNKDFSEWSYPRQVIPAGASDYACCLGVPCVTYGSNTYGTWMTRTISLAANAYGPNCAVYSYGTQFVGQQVHGTSGVRPAMRISPALLQSGDLTEPQRETTGMCGKNVRWTFDADSGVLSLTGTGDMATVNAFTDYGYSVWQNDIRFVAAADGVTSIGAHAFEGCPLLEETILGANVTRIGTAAFTDCPQLLNVTLLSKTIAADGAFSADRSDRMMIFSSENVQAIELAKRIGSKWIIVAFKDNVLSFGSTITVYDDYAYLYLPMFVQRYGSAEKVVFNRLIFANVPADSVVRQAYMRKSAEDLTMENVEITLLYVSEDGEQTTVTYDRMIELLESGDYRAFKLHIDVDGGQKTTDQALGEKDTETFSSLPQRVIRLVSKAINFIISIFKK